MHRSLRRIGIENLKYTSGEKCLFIHTIITFIIILLLLFVYIVHLFVVKHSPFETVKTRRKSLRAENLTPNYGQVGFLFLNPSPNRVICNTLLISSKWSLAPAHCVSIRTDPDLVFLLPNWSIKYIGPSKQGLVTGVKSSITHPHFSRNNFESNIGMLEHSVSLEINPNEMIFDPNVIEIPKFDYSNVGNMRLVGWKLPGNYVQIAEVIGFTLNNCTSYKKLITSGAFRDYEFCVYRHPNDFERECIEQGAALYRNGQIIGFFSWGEKCNTSGAPVVIIDLSMFIDWIKERLIMME